MGQRNTMLPEWAEQEAVMLAWPHESTDWLPWLEEIERDYAELAIAIAAEVGPLILCRDALHQERISRMLGTRCRNAPMFMQVAYNDTWCRDYGPLATSGAEGPRLLDFRFQGWGAKYDAALDDRINRALARCWQAPLASVDFELEGGSIETDGEGTLLTTRHCLLESNRNRHYTPGQVERLLFDRLGIERILWISEGMLEGDDTDSHIDNLVRFCSPDTLAYAACSRSEDVHHGPLQRLAAQVQALTRADGSPYNTVPLELPQPQFDEQGNRLPGSYVNFLILNKSVLVPVFGCGEDAMALNALGACFPDRKLVPVPGCNLIRQFGGPHCATMQLPKGVLRRS